MADTRDVHIRFTAQTGTTVHIIVAGDDVVVTSDSAGSNTEIRRERWNRSPISKEVLLRSRQFSRRFAVTAQGLRGSQIRIQPQSLLPRGTKRSKSDLRSSRRS
jgi:hypothetical protein